MATGAATEAKQPAFALQKAIVLASVGLALLSFAFYFPGDLTPDAADQLEQARTGRYTDWHPPIMAMIWSAFPRTEAMLALQITLHWIGIALLASKLSGKWRWVMLAVGLTPIASKYLGVIQKDTLLASFFIAAFGLATHSRVAAVAVGLLGSLTRMNGVFAFPPLVFPKWGLVKTIAAGLALSAAMIPAAMVFNRLMAEPTGVERSLKLYDMAGIEHFSGKDVPCYTPLFWDSLDSCFRRDTRGWLIEITKHPVAYAQHRIAHFNSATFFLVPAMHQCVEAPEMHNCARASYLADAITKNALLWPVTWLTIGILFLFARPEPFARNLALSGLLYGGAYLFVGVASDFRYFYWTELAVQVAIVLHLAGGRKLPLKPLALAVTLVWIAGYAARYA